MSKIYRVEVKFGASWVCVDTMTRHTDALHYVKEKSGENYPMRIVRIVKTVVFEEKK
jgi:hypothetical protein